MIFVLAIIGAVTAALAALAIATGRATERHVNADADGIIQHDADGWYSR